LKNNKVAVMRLGESALSFVDGPFGSDLQSREYTEAGVPIARIQNVRPNQFNASNQIFISEKKAEALRRHDYAPGDVLITKLGEPCGIACMVPEGSPSGRIVADVTRFRGDPKIVDHSYLVHYLNAPAGWSEVRRRAKGTTRQRINLTSLKERRCAASASEPSNCSTILPNRYSLRYLEIWLAIGPSLFVSRCYDNSGMDFRQQRVGPFRAKYSPSQRLLEECLSQLRPRRRCSQPNRR